MFQKDQKRIQIIYLSSADHNDPDSVGHWVTSYYDTNYIYIYDSINNKVMHRDLEKSLRILHPYYFEICKEVIFPSVQQQKNIKDCGYFAIAFAISLLCDIKPDQVRYSTDAMHPHLLKLLLNQYIEHYPCSIIPIPISLAPRNLYNRDIIINNSCLNDEHIDYFHQMLLKISLYKPCSTLYLQNTSKILQINEQNKHIQILFQHSHTVGHFICTYYDTNSLFVYDSINNTELHSDFIKVLEKLHPYCFNQHKKPIIFKKVQSQTNATDCGVYAIAFAVTVLFGYKPEAILYNQKEMRKHLLKMFENRSIQHFACINDISNNCTLFNFNNTINEGITAPAFSNNIAQNKKRKIDQNSNEIFTDSSKKAKTPSIAIKNKNKTYYEKNKDKLLQARKEKRKMKKSKYLLNSPSETDNETLKYLVQQLTPSKIISNVAKNSFTETKEHILSQSHKKSNTQLNINAQNYKNNDIDSHNIFDSDKSKEMSCSENSDIHLNRISKKSLKNKRYYEDHKEKILSNRKVHYMSKKTEILKKRSNKYNCDKLLLIKKNQNKIRNKILMANKIKKKYNVMNVVKDSTIKLLKNTENFISKIMIELGSSYSSSQRRLDAENLVSTSIYVRDNYMNEAKKVLKNLQNKIELSLTRLGNVSIMDNVDCALTALCGISKHTSSSEPYFSEAAYDFRLGLFNDFNIDNKIIINEKGKTTNILPLIEDETNKSRVWQCNVLL